MGFGHDINYGLDLKEAEQETPSMSVWFGHKRDDDG